MDNCTPDADKIDQKPYPADGTLLFSDMPRRDLSLDVQVHRVKDGKAEPIGIIKHWNDTEPYSLTGLQMVMKIGYTGREKKSEIVIKGLNPNMNYSFANDCLVDIAKNLVYLTEGE